MNPFNVTDLLLRVVATATQAAGAMRAWAGSLPFLTHALGQTGHAAKTASQEAAESARRMGPGRLATLLQPTWRRAEPPPTGQSSPAAKPGNSNSPASAAGQSSSAALSGLERAALGVTSTFRALAATVSASFLGRLARSTGLLQGGQSQSPIAKVAQSASDRNDPLQSLNKSILFPALGKKFPGMTGEEMELVHREKTRHAEYKSNEAAKSIAALMGLGRAASGVAAVFTGIVASAKIFADIQMAHGEQLRQFSGRIALAYNELDRDRLRRQFQNARATAGSTEMMVAAMNRLEKTLQPYQQVMTNVLNGYVAGVATTAEAAIKVAENTTTIGQAMKLARELFGNNKDDFDPQFKLLDQLAQGELTKRRERKRPPLKDI